MFRRTMPLSPSGAFLRWLWWQVIVPLAGPILLAVIVAYTWMSIEPSFQLDWSILIDITPWAVTFFCIGLVGSTMDVLWDLLTKGIGNEIPSIKLLALEGRGLFLQ